MTWHLNDGQTVTIPAWLAKITSGRCTACGMGSLFYMWQGWGTVTAKIDLVHRRTHMKIHAGGKLCGWCHRKARRDVAATHPDVASAAPFWDQENFNRLARYEEITMLTTGLNEIFPAADYRIDYIWVYRTNRYLDYPALEAFNYY